MDNESTSTITESINALWILSKDNKVPSEAEGLTLKKALAVLFPDMNLLETKPVDNRENPLNLIISAYETLWRVVLSGFLSGDFCQGSVRQMEIGPGTVPCEPHHSGQKRAGTRFGSACSFCGPRCQRSTPAIPLSEARLPPVQHEETSRASECCGKYRGLPAE